MHSGFTDLSVEGLYSYDGIPPMGYSVAKTMGSESHMEEGTSISPMTQNIPSDVLMVSPPLRKVRYTIQYMHGLAKERGGKCLSNEYKRLSAKLKWECEKGHKWEVAPQGVIYNGSWCPHCTKYIQENICRKSLEYLFNIKFPKKRVAWLVNPNTNRKLELDGYNKELGIAFEYHGIQHYKICQYAPNDEILSNRKKIDILKKQLCNSNHVKLIIIPYYIKKENLMNFILYECKRKNINVPPQIVLEAFDYKTFDGVYSSEKLNDYREIAKKRGGSCLSNVYINAKTKLKWQCKEDHVWETTPNCINNGSWCPECVGKNRGGTQRLTIEKMQKIAKEKKGKCLSSEYKNSCTKLRWQCKKRHEWNAVYSSIQQGSWCPECGTDRAREGIRKYNVGDMQQIAKNHGGVCLSTKKYINIKTKLKWRCKDGHVWKVSPQNIIYQYTWCPMCKGKRISESKKNKKVY